MTVRRSSSPFRPVRPNSFTLLELLVVMGIIGILVALSIPSIFGVLRGTNLTVGGGRLVDQLNLARQTAFAKNCRVEFRFYQLPDAGAPISGAPSVYRAFQAYSLDNNGTQTNAVTKMIFLPDGVAMANNSTVSSLLPSTAQDPPYIVDGSSAGTSAGIYPPSSYSYVNFHFKPDGSTDLSPNTAWFVSLANQRDAIQGATLLPVNFYTVQIDAQSGRVRSFRPN